MTTVPGEPASPVAKTVLTIVGVGLLVWIVPQIRRAYRQARHDNPAAYAELKRHRLKSVLKGIAALQEGKIAKMPEPVFTCGAPSTPGCRAP